MSDEQTNGSETSVRRAFRVKLSPGPKEEIIVLADDAAHAFELIGAKFGGWENIERYEISEIGLIVEDDPQEPPSLPSADTMRLRSCLSFIRQVAFGENPHIVPDSIPDYAEEELQSVIRLRANYDRRVEEIDRLTKEIKTWKSHMADCRRVATGEIVNLMDCLVGPSAALSAILDLKQKLEAMEKRWRDATAYKPAPPGPVPTAPPDGPAQIGPGSDDYGTASFEAMTGPSKPAEVTGTGDAKKGEAPRYGELKWEFWRADTPMEDRTFFIARYADGDERAFVYWPTQGVLEVSQWDAITENCHIISSEVSERDLQVLNQKMEEKGYAP